MDGVILVHVLHVVDRDEGVVDGHDLDVGAVGCGAHDKTEGFLGRGWGWAQGSGGNEIS